MAYQNALQAAAPPHGQVAGGGGSLDTTGAVVRALEVLTLKQTEALEEQRDLLTALPDRMVTKLQEPAAKAGSCCTTGDWQAFCFAAKGSLRIPALDDPTLTKYRTVLNSSEKHVSRPGSQEKLSISEAFTILDLKNEKQGVHVLTSAFLEECLNARSERCLQLDSEVGYFSEKWRKYGFGDKAGFSIFSTDKPSDYRPSTGNVSKGFWSPVVLVGAIEEKALGVKLEKEAMAELASEMAGYVEAAYRVYGIRFACFPGMLISVPQVTGNGQFIGRCVQWRLENGCERRLVSNDLDTFDQFCAGLEWWFRQCESLLDAIRDAPKSGPTRPVLLEHQEASEPTDREHSSNYVSSADDEGLHVDEAAARGQEAQAPTPKKGTTSAAFLCEQSLDSLQHVQLMQNCHKASSSLQCWLSSTISLAQSENKVPSSWKVDMLTIK
eukprot:CAMPEP_0173418620 /NCGR_PEP_ID=MMETSP1357-20121228/708_1 /TAXON_ID=77926 /ORGANISM="Hemiselmis rufescens, Strain PCC563" /LENGTH=438 /DNA_ID=CAMNT_0014381137 /DNA_START=66 /DNA_END=1382 /DNA_ORIENTATION=-